MPSCPRNYPFYNWVPKPIGIIILLFFFLPILSVGGVYSVNSTEMMSGLGIISEHIQFANFVTSIGMAAFAQYLFAGTLQPADRVPAYGTDDGQSVYADQICFWHGGNA